MKIKLTKAQVEEILANPEKAQEIGIKTSDHWWVIVLKVLAYLIGLLVLQPLAALPRHALRFFNL